MFSSYGWGYFDALQDSQAITLPNNPRRHVTFADHVNSSESEQSDEEPSLLVKKRTKKLAIDSSNSDSDEKPFDSSELSARTKHTIQSAEEYNSDDSYHSNDSHHGDDHSDDSHHDDNSYHGNDSHHSDDDDSPSRFLDCEAEEVWESDVGCGSDDIQDFIVDDTVEEWRSCDADEVDDNSIDGAHSILPRCHGRKLPDSSDDGRCGLYYILV